MKTHALLIISFLFAFAPAKCLDSLNTRLYLHAEEASIEHTIRVESLTTYLIAAAKNDYQRVEVIFYWIAQNIEYDFEAYTEDVYFENYEETYVRRRGICQNYSALLKKMCDLAGVPCYTVSGYAKGHTFEIGHFFTKTNHSWNVVKIEGDYYFIDPTWGSGKFREEDYGFQYLKGVDRRQVLVQSDYFREEHLPADPKWQLQDAIVTMDDYIWNDRLKDVELVSRIPYAYRDSIAAYENLSPEDRVINTLLSANNYFYTDHNAQLLSSYCYAKAYDRSQEPYNRTALVRSKKLYSISIRAFEQLLRSDSTAVEWIAKAKTGIQYLEYRLKSKQ